MLAIGKQIKELAGAIWFIKMALSTRARSRLEPDMDMATLIGPNLQIQLRQTNRKVQAAKSRLIIVMLDIG